VKPKPNGIKMNRSKVPDAAIEKALKASFGNISAAAKSLGMDRSHVNERIKRSITLTKVLEDTRESMKDNAESSLNRAILAGEAWAVCFFLKTRGRDRGYSERFGDDKQTWGWNIKPSKSG
jgi:hypothetical protein